MCREPVGEGAKRVTTAGMDSGVGAEGEVMAGVIAPVPANPSLAARARRFLFVQVADQTLRWRLWAPVAFGGGCFLNALLSTQLSAQLHQRGLRVLRPVRVSPGDGGIALGQAWVAQQIPENPHHASCTPV